MKKDDMKNVYDIIFSDNEEMNRIIYQDKYKRTTEIIDYNFIKDGGSVLGG